MSDKIRPIEDGSIDEHDGAPETVPVLPERVKVAAATSPCADCVRLGHVSICLDCSRVGNGEVDRYTARLVESAEKSVVGACDGCTDISNTPSDYPCRVCTRSGNAGPIAVDHYVLREEGMCDDCNKGFTDTCTVAEGAEFDGACPEFEPEPPKYPYPHVEPCWICGAVEYTEQEIHGNMYAVCSGCGKAWAGDDPEYRQGNRNGDCADRRMANVARSAGVPVPAPLLRPLTAAELDDNLRRMAEASRGAVADERAYERGVGEVVFGGMKEDTEHPDLPGPDDDGDDQ